MGNKLYVGNLAYSVSNDDLRDLFSQVGQVQSATVITDKFSGQSKGFGFVEMSNAEEASKAIQTLNDTDLKGRNIKVVPKRTNIPGMSRGRGRGRGGGRGFFGGRGGGYVPRGGYRGGYRGRGRGYTPY